jgi:hypothetical protein
VRGVRDIPVKRKKNSAGSPDTAIRKHQRETSWEDPIALFTKCLGHPDALSRVFAKPGSGRVKDGCIGNCIPCRKKKGCEIYKKIKVCFNSPGRDA